MRSDTDERRSRACWPSVRGRLHENGIDSEGAEQVEGPTNDGKVSLQLSLGAVECKDARRCCDSYTYANGRC